MGSRWAALAAAIGLALWPAAALAQETHADWLAKPSGDDLAEAYPERAQNERVEGHAVIHCKVATTGRLDDCKVVSEEPAGYGFGAAALKLAPSFRMAPATAGGSARTGDVRIPIRFALPKDAEQAGPALGPAAMVVLLACGVGLLVVVSVPALAALNDRWRRRGARTANIGVALERGFSLVGPAWREAPAALILYAAALGGLQALGPPVGATPDIALSALWRMLAFLPVVAGVGVIARGAMMRVALRPLRPGDPAFAGRGLLGLRLGRVELRILLAAVALFLLLLTGEAMLALAATLIVLWARAAQAGPPVVAVLAVVGGLTLALAGLAALRLSTFATAWVAEGAPRLGASWRATRACLLPPLITQLVMGILVGLAGSCLGGVAMIVAAAAKLGLPQVALGLGYGLGAGALAPIFVGASVYFYEALQAPRAEA